MRSFFGRRSGLLDEALREIRATQVHAIFRQLPIALAVNTVNAILTAVVLKHIANAMIPIAWLGVTLLVTAGRGVLWLRYRCAGPDSQSSVWWSKLAACGALLAGTCWGLGGVIMFSTATIPGQIFLTLVIGGMCAGAVVTNASHLPSLLAFVLAASLPLAALFLFQGAATATALGTMILVFAAAVSAAGLHLNSFIVQTMRLRLELSAANLRLRAEIAEREATEAALRQAQKLEAIGQLTGGISHDFNNLLTVMAGNLTLAIARARDNAAILPLLQSALQAAERGAGLVQRLLAFARKEQLDPRPVDLRRLVAGIEELLRRTLGDRVEIAISADADLAPANVDANQLELAILNLTINARDAMPNGGILRIGLHNRRTGRGSPSDLSSGDYVVLSISDTGTGMDEATLARAFEPFFTTKEIGSGSGLGLSMVQSFAAQSGGAVQIHSKPGKGTAVELWLPRPEEAVSPGR